MQPLKRHRTTCWRDMKYPRSLLCVDRELCGAGAVDRQIVGDREFTRAKRNRARKSCLKLDCVCAHRGVGIKNGLPETAQPRVAQVVDREDGQQPPVFQRLDSQATMMICARDVLPRRFGAPAATWKKAGRDLRCRLMVYPASIGADRDERIERLDYGRAWRDFQLFILVVTHRAAR